MYITGYLQKIKSIQWVLTNRFTFRTYHMSFYFFFERGDILIFKINQNKHELKIGFNIVKFDWHNIHMERVKSFFGDSCGI